MSTRYRGNFLYGTLSGYNATQTTFTGTGFPNNITTGTYLPIVINPGYNGITASGEIVYVTSVATGGVITVSGRGGVEGTTAGSGGTGTQWIAGPLASDFGLANQINNGDFPAPTVSGQLLVSTSTSGGTWSNAVTINGGNINHTAISGGSANIVAISGSSINTSTIYTGNTFQTGSVPPSGIAPGVDGQLLVTSGSTTVWNTVNSINSGFMNGSWISTNYYGSAGVANAVANVTVSGHLHYLFTGICTARSVFAGSGTGAFVNLALTYLDTGTGYWVNLGSTVNYPLPAYTGSSTANNDSIAARQVATTYAWTAPTRGSYTLALIPYEGLADRGGVTAQYGQITGIGIG